MIMDFTPIVVVILVMILMISTLCWIIYKASGDDYWQ